MKSNKSNFGTAKMKRPSTALRSLTPKKLRYAIFFNEDGRVTHFSDPTIYDDINFSSCHIPYTHNYLHTMSSYIQSNKKLFQAYQFNLSIRPDLLYFSV